MATKVISMEKIEAEPAGEKEFIARQGIKVDERNLFFSDFNAFVKLMKTHPVKWETRLVHKRNLRAKDTPLLYENCFDKPVAVSSLLKKREDPIKWASFKDKCEVSKELDEKIDRISKLKKSDEPDDKKKYKKESGKRINIPKIGSDGKKVPLIKEIALPTKDKLKWVSTSGIIDPYVAINGKSYTPNTDGTFNCSEMTPIQFRIMGPLPAVRKITDSIINMNLGKWSVSKDDVNFSKLVVDKVERNSGALCSDTIRAYINPVEEEETEFSD